MCSQEDFRLAYNSCIEGIVKSIMDMGACGWIILNIASDTCGFVEDSASEPNYVMGM